MIQGVPLRLGDRELTVPPITIGQLRNGVKALIDEHDKLAGDGADLFALGDIRAQIVLAALRRNYGPDDLPDTEFFNSIDLGSIGEVWMAVLFGSGLRPPQPGAAPTPPVMENGASGESSTS